MLFLPRLLVRRVLAFLPAELFQRQPVGPARLLVGAVVAAAAQRTLQPDVLAHDRPPCEPRRPRPVAIRQARAAGGLLQDLGDHAGADGTATLADGEAEAFVHGDRRIL